MARDVFFGVGAILAAAGCPWSNHHPCPDDGIVRDNVRYANDAYYDPSGGIFGVTGNTPLTECTEIRGKIILAGEVSDFSDFDNIVSIEGFADANVDLPSAGDVLDGLDPILQGCGLIQGFPNLRRMEGIQMEYNSFVDITEGCIFYDGFGALEYAGADFRCTGTDSVGSALVEVVGELRCKNERLQNLERVGQLRLDGAALPMLRSAGALSGLGFDSESTAVSMPRLEIVGDEYEPRGPVPLDPGLFLSGRFVETIDLASLRRVEGDFTVAAMGVSNTEAAWYTDRGRELKQRFFDVEVTGRKRVCRNGPNDPCPDDPVCIDIYGIDSIWCCDLTWPECLELYPPEDT